MKKLTEAIPFALLLGLVPYFYLNTPNIAQSIIVLAVAGLCGYRLYALEKEKPDYVQIFQEEFNSYKEQRDEELKNLHKRHEAAMVHLEAKVKELDSNYAKSTMSQTRSNMRNFEF